MPGRRFLSQDWALDNLRESYREVDLDVQMYQRQIDDPALADPHKLLHLIEQMRAAERDRDRIGDRIAGMRR